MKTQLVQDILSLVNAIADLTLIASYVYVLRQLKRGTKYRLFITITTLLIIASCDDILLTFTNQQLLKYADGDQNERIVAVIALNGLTQVIYQACYGISQWLFAFEYFKISYMMPLAVQGLEQKPDWKLNALNLAFLLLNLATAVLNGIFLFITNYRKFQGKDVGVFKVITTILLILGTLLELTSNCFVLYSVFSISRYIKKGLRPYYLNQRNILLHAVAFSLYSVALII